MENTTIRVLLVDDHRVFREGLRELLNHRPDIEVVADAGTGQEALRKMTSQPDVVVMDIRLPDANGITVCRRIMEDHNNARVVMLTMFGDDDHLLESVEAGASGFVRKDADIEAVVSAIRAAARGHSDLDPASTALVLDGYRKLVRERNAGQRSALSKRELRMVDLIARGATNRQIAEDLNLSEQTVKNGLSVLYQKLGVRNRAEAVVAVMRNGIEVLEDWADKQ